MAFNIPNGAFRLTPEEAGGQPNYTQALRDAFSNSQAATETAYKPKNMAEALLASQLQNKINKPKADDASNWYQAELKNMQATTGLNSANAQKIMQSYAQEKWLNDMLNNGGNPSHQQNQPSPQPGMPNQQPSPIDNSNNPNVSYDGPGPNYGAPTARNTFPNRFGKRPDEASQQPWVNGVNNMPQPGQPAPQQITPQVQQVSAGPQEQVLTPGNSQQEYLNKMWDEMPGARKALEARGIKKTTVAKVDPRTGLTSIMTTYPNGKITVQNSIGENGKMPLTNAVKTLNQNIIGQAPKAIKAIQAIKKAPSPFEIPYVPYFKGERKQHYSLTQSAAETYAKAKGWPNTGESIKAAYQILDRGTGESDHDYHQRLDTLQEQLKDDVKTSQDILDNKPSAQQETSQGKTIEYVLKNGRYVPK